MIPETIGMRLRRRIDRNDFSRLAGLVPTIDDRHSLFFFSYSYSYSGGFLEALAIAIAIAIANSGY